MDLLSLKYFLPKETPGCPWWDGEITNFYKSEGSSRMQPRGMRQEGTLGWTVPSWTVPRSTAAPQLACFSLGSSLAMKSLHLEFSGEKVISVISEVHQQHTPLPWQNSGFQVLFSSLPFLTLALAEDPGCHWVTAQGRNSFISFCTLCNTVRNL